MVHGGPASGSEGVGGGRGGISYGKGKGAPDQNYLHAMQSDSLNSPPPTLLEPPPEPRAGAGWGGGGNGGGQRRWCLRGGGLEGRGAGGTGRLEAGGLPEGRGGAARRGGGALGIGTLGGPVGDFPGTLVGGVLGGAVTNWHSTTCTATSTSRPARGAARRRRRAGRRRRVQQWRRQRCGLMQLSHSCCRPRGMLKQHMAAKTRPSAVQSSRTESEPHVECRRMCEDTHTRARFRESARRKTL